MTTRYIIIGLAVIIGLAILATACAKKEAQNQQPQASTAAAGQVITTSSGLQYQILQEGSGDAAQAGKRVSVHYTGWLTNGTKFYSSVDRGQVIKGWDEGVAGMKVGEKRKLTIPSNLAYGPQGRPGAIPPNSTLIFDVELLGIQ
jgi:FKBP-type peptidyl-prolyl cis-trans isomerase FkpA